MGPGVRVDTTRTRQSEILAGLGAAKGDDGADGSDAESSEPAEEPAAA
jgi:hypothetical protein